MSTVCFNRMHNLECSLEIADPGTAIEFGVHQGRTLAVIRQHFDGVVVGFDSFEGLPDTWRDGYEKGHFASEIAPLIPGTTIVAGLFEEVGFEVFGHLEPNITFVHFDCDLYQSTLTALNLVTPLLWHRAIFVFDEYRNYPGWQQHEHEAFAKWRQWNPRFAVTEVSHVPTHQQATFEILRK